MDESPCTPGQTVGPFFGIGLPFPGDNDLAGDRADAITLHGNVFDGAGAAVPDALIEIWQPDGAGQIARATGSLRRDGATFTGWGRAATDVDGHYSFRTVVPGPTSPARPAFFAVTVFARGLLHRLCTRAYVPGAALDIDPALPAPRRATLACVAESDSRLRFDIHLQGPRETVFLAFREDRR